VTNSGGGNSARDIHVGELREGDVVGPTGEPWYTVLDAGRDPRSPNSSLWVAQVCWAQDIDGHEAGEVSERVWPLQDIGRMVPVTREEW
jgi:hypothetical protein